MNRRQLMALVEAQTTGRQEQAKNAAQDGRTAPKQSERDWQATVLKYAATERKRYRTIVADPPWPLKGAGASWAGTTGIDRRGGGSSRPIPYQTMTVDQIASIPVVDIAEQDAHLYLWTMNAFLEDAYKVARAWGFKPSQLLVWAKTPRGLGLGGSFTSTCEYVLFCRRGSLPALTKIDTCWWNWKRPEAGTGPMHSRKPEAFIDMVEQVSPPPYVELFARRHRLGWDVWGNESANTATLEGLA